MMLNKSILFSTVISMLLVSESYASGRGSKGKREHEDRVVVRAAPQKLMPLEPLFAEFSRAFKSQKWPRMAASLKVWDLIQLEIEAEAGNDFAKQAVSRLEGMYKSISVSMLTLSRQQIVSLPCLLDPAKGPGKRFLRSLFEQTTAYAKFIWYVNHWHHQESNKTEGFGSRNLLPPELSQEIAGVGFVTMQLKMILPDALEDYTVEQARMVAEVDEGLEKMRVRSLKVASLARTKIATSISELWLDRLFYSASMMCARVSRVLKLLGNKAQRFKRAPFPEHDEGKLSQDWRQVAIEFFGAGIEGRMQAFCSKIPPSKGEVSVDIVLKRVGYQSRLSFQLFVRLMQEEVFTIEDFSPHKECFFVKGENNRLRLKEHLFPLTEGERKWLSERVGDSQELRRNHRDVLRYLRHAGRVTALQGFVRKPVKELAEQFQKIHDENVGFHKTFQVPSDLKNQAVDSLIDLQVLFSDAAALLRTFAQEGENTESLHVQRKFVRKVSEVLETMDNVERILGIDRHVPEPQDTPQDVPQDAPQEHDAGHSHYYGDDVWEVVRESREAVRVIEQRRQRKEAAKAAKNHKGKKSRGKKGKRRAAHQVKQVGKTPAQRALRNRTSALNKAKIVSGQEFFEKPAIEEKVIKLKSILRRSKDFGELKRLLDAEAGDHYLKFLSEFEGRPMGVFSVRLNENLRMTFVVLDMEMLRISQVKFSDHYKNVRGRTI